MPQVSIPFAVFDFAIVEKVDGKSKGIVIFGVDVDDCRRDGKGESLITEGYIGGKRGSLDWLD